MKTRQEQIEEMLHDLNNVVIWSDKDAEIDRIMPVIYWLEVELRGEKEIWGKGKAYQDFLKGD